VFESGVTYGSSKSERSHAMPRKKTTNRKRLQRVSIRAELRSEPDWDRFAWALLQHARLLSANKDTSSKKGKPQP
jgi:hypothetical protein